MFAVVGSKFEGIGLEKVQMVHIQVVLLSRELVDCDIVSL